MMTFTELAPAASDPPEPFTDRLRLAVAAYLARFKGSSREHTESDLRCYLSWRAERGLDPLAAQRPHLELYIRWMQELRRFKPSTVSRRFSVVAGFYRTCVIDGLMQHSPAEHVRRPAVPAESPTLAFTHLQFEALLTAARESPNACDFALVAMLGLLGLRIFAAEIHDGPASGADPVAQLQRRGPRRMVLCRHDYLLDCSCLSDACKHPGLHSSATPRCLRPLAEIPFPQACPLTDGGQQRAGCAVSLRVGEGLGNHPKPGDYPDPGNAAPWPAIAPSRGDTRSQG